MPSLTLISREHLEDETGELQELAELHGLDIEDFDPWEVASEVDIGITGNKDFLAGHLYQETESDPPKLVSAVFASPITSSCFAFDIVVLPEFQGKGLGNPLVDEAIAEYEDLSRLREEIFEDSKYEYCVNVVNPHAKRLLERKGFVVYETYEDWAGSNWMMKRGAK